MFSGYYTFFVPTLIVTLPMLFREKTVFKVKNPPIRPKFRVHLHPFADSPSGGLSSAVGGRHTPHAVPKPLG